MSDIATNTRALFDVAEELGGVSQYYAFKASGVGPTIAVLRARLPSEHTYEKRTSDFREEWIADVDPKTQHCFVQNRDALEGGDLPFADRLYEDHGFALRDDSERLFDCFLCDDGCERCDGTGKAVREMPKGGQQ